MIHRLWSSLLNIGIGSESAWQERKYVNILNGSLFFAVLVSFLSIPLVNKSYFNAIPMISVLVFSCAVMVCAYLSFNGHRTAARLIFTVAVLLDLCTVSAMSSPQSFVHIYLLNLVVGMPFLFPERERHFGLMGAGVALLGFLVFSLSGLGGYGLIAMPPHYDLVAARISNIIGSSTTLLVLAIMINRSFREAEDRAILEHQRSEHLLSNILPNAIIERLKNEETYIAEYFEHTTILFADIVGFTAMSSKRPPHEIVAMLNKIFTSFDRLAQEHGVEKIKTIGDAYMAISGAPERVSDHANRIAKFALDIQKYIKDEFAGNLHIRIGIHTGAVTAGIIGEKKFSYDLWGDAVNTASRMESHGITGEIHCSQQYFDALNEQFVFEPRGEIEIKSKGRLSTYLLRASREHPVPNLRS